MSHEGCHGDWSCSWPERARRSSVGGMVVLERAGTSDRGALREELSAYLLEFAELERVPAPSPEQGLAAYRWFDLYWSSEDRLPFLIRASGSVAGFCLVRVMDGGWNIAEFAINPAWRRQGVGGQAVNALARAAKQAGADHLRADVHAWNHRGLSFWQACGFTAEQMQAGIVPTRLRLEPVG
jgi:ribosomal protein S18 acetylase RimI-like enzyme